MANSMLTITRKDIGERYWVKVKMSPDIPRDKLMQAQIVKAYREPGPDGKPFMSDVDIAQMIDVPHPEEIRQRVDMQMYEAQSQEVQELKKTALWRLWKQEHRDMVRLAERAMADEDAEWEDMKRTMSREDFEQIIQFKVEAEMMKRMGQDPGQTVEQQQQQMAMQQMAAEKQAGLPASVQPPGPAGPTPGQAPGPAPQVMPSQEMMVGNEQSEMMNVPAMEARQARRGRPHNKP